MQTIKQPDGTIIRFPDGAIFHPNGIPDYRECYVLSNLTVTSGGGDLPHFAGNYYCEVGDIIQIKGYIVDSQGNPANDIDVSVALKMPVVRHANGVPTTDEIYMNTTIKAGVITVTGKIERSGDWKILIERNNEALQRIGAEFKFGADDITFLV